MTGSSPNPDGTPPASGASRTIACLQFFERWETPLDQQAANLYVRLRHEAPDFAGFLRMAPAGSEARALFERFVGSFEEAGRLIREGRMREDLFFDSWYALPAAWLRLQPYVLGLRDQYQQPALYENFEWVARRSEEFWEEQRLRPIQWRPMSHPEPTPDDRAVFESFHRHMFPDSANPGWALFAKLEEQAPTFEAASQVIPQGSPEYVTFDWLICAYERAGVLIKNGIVHPALLLATWRSPQEVWRTAEPWVKGVRQESKVEQLYENAEWLAAFEAEWQQKENHPPT